MKLLIHVLLAIIDAKRVLVKVDKIVFHVKKNIHLILTITCVNVLIVLQELMLQKIVKDLLFVKNVMKTVKNVKEVPMINAQNAVLIKFYETRNVSNVILI